jgi:hypothetical protein
MFRYYLILCLLIPNVLGIYAQQTKVLTLGTFHFAFYNKDIIKTEKNDQIDVLAPEHQAEIEKITDMLAEFNPTLIAIEANPRKQSRMDSLYKAYFDGNYSLKRNETDQIGFRLAKQLGLKKLYCVDDWGEIPESVAKVLNGSDSVAKNDFYNTFYNNPDSLLFYEKEHVFKSEGILADLIELNKEDHLKKDLGNYLISVFKYETEDNPFFGTDFTTGWWFNRNLRIFRNIQRIGAGPEDRILVIYGSGHMNILNILFDASPEFKLVPVSEYLK